MCVRRPLTAAKGGAVARSSLASKVSYSVSARFLRQFESLTRSTPPAVPRQASAPVV